MGPSFGKKNDSIITKIKGSTRWPLGNKGCWSSCDEQLLTMCINCEFPRLGSYFWIDLLEGL